MNTENKRMADGKLNSSVSGQWQGVGRYSNSLRADGPGIESEWELDFPYLSRPAPRPTQAPMQGVPVRSWG